MRRPIMLKGIAALALAAVCSGASIAHAANGSADIAGGYQTSTTSKVYVPPVVTLCPSTDGSNTAVACTSTSVTVSPNSGTMTPINATTSSTAGAPQTLASAGAITKGFTIQNTCTTAEWWSNSLGAGTTLTASNSMTLAAGQSFTSPDWWAPGGALIIASATAAACTVAGSYK